MSGVGEVLLSFIEDHLKIQKGLRPSSIKSYRDTLKLFLVHVSSISDRPITRLTLTDLSSGRVLDFLRMIEATRGSQARTRNQRLAALHTFYRYLAVHEPEMLAEAQRVEAIPAKRTQVSETIYLERDEMHALFSKMPSQGRLALRDRALLMFLYNTGARVQEACDLRFADLDLNGPYRVRLHGKGDKWRSCPIWPETAELLKKLSSPSRLDPADPVFVSRERISLTRFGIYKIVKRHTASHLCKDSGDNPVPGAGVSPHVFRHTAAVHLLEAGVEVNVIRAWLGHVSLDTTNRYAEITLRTKQAAMAACLPPVEVSSKHRRVGGWHKDEELLKWLQSL
jgi:integrase/recombinase XerD